MLEINIFSSIKFRSTNYFSKSLSWNFLHLFGTMAAHFEAGQVNQIENSRVYTKDDHNKFVGQKSSPDVILLNYSNIHDDTSK
ncbi:hypothetical protein CEXT_383271 [Caerostris extrusa]|uniref:Uncharacterized protein n=1 Tax=Caerostris extrusa TaxID=172846 RepID=A0AAV4X8K7_CAEEX|nr:hypothetical protein CEXT_383271 [Caerostris extrusa]